MKKNLITLVCASFFCTTVCIAKTTVKETRETGAFRRISTEAGIDVYFTQSNSYSVVVEADKENVDKIVTMVKDETLVIKRKENIRKLISNKTYKVHVSAPALDKASSLGGSDFYADKLECEKSFQLTVSGGASADITSLTVNENVDISATGGANIDINTLTVAGNANISALGGADCDVKILQTTDCNLSSKGGSDLSIDKLTASGNLNAEAVGGADISVSGIANKVTISSLGGSDVDIKRLTYTIIDISKSGGGSVYR
jgi:hypothetical protein